LDQISVTNVHSVQYLQASQQQVIAGLLQSRQGASIRVNVYSPSWFNNNCARPRRMFIINTILYLFVAGLWIRGLMRTNGPLKH
jgi:hypothetical protein